MAPILLAVAVLALFTVIYFVARNERVRRRVLCPRSGEDAEVEMVQRFEGDKKPVSIKSCDQLPDPENVDCDQDCIRSS